MRLRNIPGSRDVIAASNYVIQDPKSMKGHWSEVFGNSNEIHIEVGMGKGRFLRDLSAAHPDINYIGIEMYSSVLVRAIEKAEEAEEQLSNFRFLRMDARDLPEVFEKGEISKIYLNFSDPWPKERHAKRRLTSVQFLAKYQEVLLPGKQVEFKTDNKDLFDFSLSQIKEKAWVLDYFTFDLHHDEALSAGNIMTEYEERFSKLGQNICKLCAHY